MSSPATADPSAPAKSATAKAADWRSPLVIVLGGCLIAMLAFGPRSALGFFLTPLSAANGWGRDVFALAIAAQSLLYGAAQPFAGALADRFGAQRVIVAGALLYALGIFLMAQASTPAMLYLSAGVLVGFGLSGCSLTWSSPRSPRWCRRAGARWCSAPARPLARSGNFCTRRSVSP